MSEVQEFPVEREYTRTGVSAEDVRRLRDWLATQPHLPAQHLTDLDLVLTAHCCECSSSVTKQVLDLHFTLRTLFNNLFKDRVVNDRVLKTFDVITYFPLETRTASGEAVYYGALLDTDSKNFNFSDAIRVAIMVLDLWQYEEGTWPGFVLALDLTGLTLGHLAKLDLQTLQQFFYYLQEAMLVKLNGLHFLNAPSFMDRLMLLIRPFMKKRLLDVLKIHQVGSRTIEEYFPMKALPKEAGGDSMSVHKIRDYSIARFKANKEYFEKENAKRVDESKRPGKPKTITDVFGGVEGSFKKLEID